MTAEVAAVWSPSTTKEAPASTGTMPVLTSTTAVAGRVRACTNTRATPGESAGKEASQVTKLWGGGEGQRGAGEMVVGSSQP